MSADALLVETYFDMLRDEAFSSRVNRREYEGALRELFNIPFYWIVWGDDNRAGDALSLRQYDFLGQQTDLSGVDIDWLNNWLSSAPSVLEVMVGIAHRWHLHFEGKVAFYFGHLWRNMEFDRHPGRALDPESTDSIRHKVDVWLSRQYQPSGHGSPFPITDQTVYDILDMRQLDIWSQMNAYSAEHFQ